MKHIAQRTGVFSTLALAVCGIAVALAPTQQNAPPQQFLPAECVCTGTDSPGAPGAGDTVGTPSHIHSSSLTVTKIRDGHVSNTQLPGIGCPTNQKACRWSVTGTITCKPGETASGRLSLGGSAAPLTVTQPGGTTSATLEINAQCGNTKNATLTGINTNPTGAQVLWMKGKLLTCNL